MTNCAVSLICMVCFVNILTQSTCENKLVNIGCSSSEYGGTPNLRNLKLVGKYIKKYKKSLNVSDYNIKLSRGLTMGNFSEVLEDSLWGFNFFSKGLQWINATTNILNRQARLTRKKWQKMNKNFYKTHDNWCHTLMQVKILRNVTDEKETRAMDLAENISVSVFEAKSYKILDLMKRFVSCMRKVNVDKLNESLEKCNCKIQKKLRGKCAKKDKKKSKKKWKKGKKGRKSKKGRKGKKNRKNKQNKKNKKNKKSKKRNRKPKGKGT